MKHIQIYCERAWAELTQVNKARIRSVCGGTMKVIACIEDLLVIRRKCAGGI